MQRRKSAQCVFEDSLRNRDWQILLGQAQEIICKVFEDKHRLLRDSVFQQTDIGTVAKTAIHVLVILEVIGRDMFQYELLVAGAGSPEISKLDRAGS